MPLCYSPQRLAPFKAIPSHLTLAIGQVVNGQAQIVWMLHHRQELLGLGKRHLPLRRLAGAALDPLVHSVHACACEIRLGVRQLLLVVRSGSLGQRQESLGLKLWDQNPTLPRRPCLDEELGEHRRQGHVLNDELLSRF